MDARIQDDAVMLHSLFPTCTLALIADMLRQHKGHVKRVMRAIKADAKRKAKAELSVAIVGGGIGGFALALALQNHGIRCRVFERDTHFDARRQGYGLTMQQGTAALRTLGFRIDTGDNLGVHSTRHVVMTSEGVQVGEWGQRKWDRAGKDNGKKVSRNNFHLPRQTLRQLLLSALRPGTVLWGCRFKEYRRVKRDTVKLRALTLSPQFIFCEPEACDEDQNKVDSEVSALTLPQRSRWSPNVNFCDEVTFDTELTDFSLHERGRSELTNVADVDRTRGRDIRAKSCDFEVTAGSCCMDTYNVEFTAEDGSDIEYAAHVVVGCDGISGTVRKQLDPEDSSPLRYLGVLVVLGIVDNLSPDSPGADVVDGRTAFQMSDSSVRLFGMPFTDRQTMWQLSWPLDETEATTLAKQGLAAVKEEVLRRCGSWAAPIPELLKRTEVDCISAWPVSDRSLVTDMCFESSAGDREAVTLLGDAAHPMSPFKGQGANQALIDAVVLANELGKCHPDGPITALRRYEAEMIARTASKVIASNEAASFLHSEVAVAVGDRTRAALGAEALQKRAVHDAERQDADHKPASEG